MTKNIAIFASGTGTNAENLIRFFADEPDTAIVLLLSSKAEAPVVGKARQHHIPVEICSKSFFTAASSLLPLLVRYEVHYILLAGFLWFIPPFLLAAFPKRIVNIHPSLLPKHGGKGMYGLHVHTAVLQEHETVSGITIHLVNEHYDQGAILCQKSCPVYPTDSPATLAGRVHLLEKKWYPIAVKDVIKDK